MGFKEKPKPKKYINIGLTAANSEKIERIKKFCGLNQQDIVNQIIREYREPTEIKDKN